MRETSRNSLLEATAIDARSDPVRKMFLQEEARPAVRDTDLSLHAGMAEGG